MICIPSRLVFLSSCQTSVGLVAIMQGTTSDSIHTVEPKFTCIRLHPCSGKAWAHYRVCTLKISIQLCQTTAPQFPALMKHQEIVGGVERLSRKLVWICHKYAAWIILYVWLQDHHPFINEISEGRYPLKFHLLCFIFFHWSEISIRFSGLPKAILDHEPAASVL